MRSEDKILTVRQTGRLLLVANVAKEHIRKFHLPFIDYMRSKDWVVDVACKLDAPVPECNNSFELPCDRNPLQGGIRKSVSVLENIIQEQHYDAIVCNTLTGSIVARLTKKKLGKRSPKLFYINHGLHFFKSASLSRWIMGYPLEKILSPFTDVLVVRRHIVGGANRTLISVLLPPRLCRTGICRRLLAE
ncbi:MAG: glycosyltransferase [Lachnospiraceae bacterium]|nr:glycosyltransferase [Lachnospiraceae bacterium]